MRYRWKVLLMAFYGWLNGVWGQDVIHLQNPSFEGIPHLGQGAIQYRDIMGVNPFSAIRDWTDCGFKSETPPDLHGDHTGYFDVTRSPQHGTSFLGMVVRYNDTWERVSQKLMRPLRGGKCYRFSIYLARDLNYKSNIKEKVDTKEPFIQPCVLRIYAGNGYCSTKELLGESVPVVNVEWKRYDFVFKPKQDWQYFELQAFYKTPVPFPYNGNILLDNASDIFEIECEDAEKKAAEPTEEPLVATSEPPNEEPRPRASEKKENPEKPEKTVTSEVAPNPKREKILKDLDGTKIKKGQVIQIEKLYFAADQSDITSQSHEVLDEVYDFLIENPKVKVEIGGHTNSKPKHEYCDRLSQSRATAVAEYLIDKGIDPNRLEAKGYGKRSPIALGNSKDAHRRNQRVEIKILTVDGTED